MQDLATSSDAENRVKAVVCECSSDVHFIISQPGISAYDFAGPDAAPFLRQVMTREDKHIEASLIIPEVVGPVDGKEIARYIESQCHAKRQTWDAASTTVENS